MVGRTILSLLLALAVSLGGCASSRERQAFEELQNRRQEVYQGPIETDTQQRPGGELPAEPSLRNYLAYAAAHNPKLQAAFSRYKAALEAVVPARTLSDPRFTYRYFIREVETRVGPQEQSFGLAQTFPWFGKLQARSDIALEKAKASGQAFETARLKLFYQVKHADYEYYYLAQAIAVTKENIELVRYLEQVARTKYKVAAAGHQDVIRAQVEQGKLEDQLRSLQDLRRPIMAKLNAALNRPAGAELPWPTEIPQEERIEPSDEQILTWLRQVNPQLKALDHRIAAEKRAIELAGKDYFPDITVGVDYIDTAGAIAASPSDSGKDPVVVMASINLPIWHDKYRANQRRARARYLAALKERLGAENTLLAEVHLALYEFRDAQRKINLYRNSLIPKAEQSLKVTQAAFMTDKASFLDLIDAQRMLLEFQLLYERSLANHAQRLAQLEMLIGRELPRQLGQDQRLKGESEAK
ncbi:MAG: TolC family protein [Actinobacteria bacterium]|nr:TolC family protein [Actinomycetota bacterium]